jgi:hypothetical protein
VLEAASGAVGAHLPKHHYSAGGNFCGRTVPVGTPLVSVAVPAPEVATRNSSHARALLLRELVDIQRGPLGSIAGERRGSAAPDLGGEISAALLLTKRVADILFICVRHYFVRPEVRVVNDIEHRKFVHEEN